MMVSFYANRFSDVPAPDAINEMPGKDLAEWLQKELTRQGFDTGEIIAEDYGFGFWTTLNNAAYWTAVNQIEAPDSDNDFRARWLIQPVYDPGCCWMNWFRKRPDPNDLYQIAEAIHDTLTNAAQIEQVEWWQDDVYQGEPQSVPPRP
jgi:hypothetical protein